MSMEEDAIREAAEHQLAEDALLRDFPLLAGRNEGVCLIDHLDLHRKRLALCEFLAGTVDEEVGQQVAKETLPRLLYEEVERAELIERLVRQDKQTVQPKPPVVRIVPRKTE